MLISLRAGAGVGFCVCVCVSTDGDALDRNLIEKFPLGPFFVFFACVCAFACPQSLSIAVARLRHRMTSSLERAKKHMHVVFHLETGLLSHFIAKEEFDLWPAQVATQTAYIKHATTLSLYLDPDDTSPFSSSSLSLLPPRHPSFLAQLCQVAAARSLGIYMPPSVVAVEQTVESKAAKLAAGLLGDSSGKDGDSKGKGKKDKPGGGGCFGGARRLRKQSSGADGDVSAMLTFAATAVEQEEEEQGMGPAMTLPGEVRPHRNAQPRPRPRLKGAHGQRRRAGVRRVARHSTNTWNQMSTIKAIRHTLHKPHPINQPIKSNRIIDKSTRQTKPNNSNHLIPHNLTSAPQVDDITASTGGKSMKRASVGRASLARFSVGRGSVARRSSLARDGGD